MSSVSELESKIFVSGSKFSFLAGGNPRPLEPTLSRSRLHGYTAIGLRGYVTTRLLKKVVAMCPLHFNLLIGSVTIGITGSFLFFFLT